MAPNEQRDSSDIVIDLIDQPGTDVEKVDPEVIEDLITEGQTDFIVVLIKKADLSKAALLKTKKEKGEFVFQTLRETAEQTQKDLRELLDNRGISYQPFYIANKILVYGGSQALLDELIGREDVYRIIHNRPFQAIDPNEISEEASPVGTGIETNITFINADDVWALGYTGQGIVLANNDTGMQWNHPALLNHYRGWDGVTADHNYNWWDATGIYPLVPGDGRSHGTHTTGTMVGDDGGGNQIGVAPGDKVIHCKNMDDTGNGTSATFTQCFQWDLAPWNLAGLNPDPSKAPDAVNNSWGKPVGGNDPQYKDEISALQAAGIVVVVAAGNEGSACTTLRSPGDYAEVLTVGAVTDEGETFPGTTAGFSSRGGSALDPGFFPDVMAPGVHVRSSIPGGGYADTNWNGTSMAAPHVTGLVALMWSSSPSLVGDVNATMDIIKKYALPLTGQMGSNCGGDYTTGPNQDWGYGTIEAVGTILRSPLACIPPVSGTWTITDSCYIDKPITAPENVVVQNNVAVIVLPTGALDVDFLNHNLQVLNGSIILIKAGGKIE